MLLVLLFSSLSIVVLPLINYYSDPPSPLNPALCVLSFWSPPVSSADPPPSPPSPSSPTLSDADRTSNPLVLYTHPLRLPPPLADVSHSPVDVKSADNQATASTLTTDMHGGTPSSATTDEGEPWYTPQRVRASLEDTPKETPLKTTLSPYSATRGSPGGVALIPRRAPPTRERLAQTLMDYGLPEVVYPEPFYSNPRFVWV